MKSLFLATILSLGIATAASATNLCVNPINPFIDPVVGAWSGSLSIPALSYNGPVNYSFHAGNTLHGQGAQCLGFPLISATGNLFSTCTGVWKRTSLTGYKIVYTDVGVNPTVTGATAVLPTSLAGRTGFFGNFSLTDCNKIVITGKIALYGVNDPKMQMTPLAGPFDATLTLYSVDIN